MRAFVAWVTARRIRLVSLAIVCAPLVPVVSAALIVLEVGRAGPGPALPSVTLTVAGVAALAIFAGSGMYLSIGGGAFAVVCGLAMGALLRWAGTLVLAFQGTVLGFLVAAAAFALFGADPNEFLSGLIDELIEVLRQNGATQLDREAFLGQGYLLLGSIEAVYLANLVAALLLGAWWLDLLSGKGRFGAECRALKLGRVLGIPALIVLSVGVVLETPLVENLTPLVLICFLFQGLVVMHAWAYARGWHPGIIVLVYLMLVLLWFVVLPVLCMVGIVDNVFDLRAPLRAPAGSGRD